MSDPLDGVLPPGAEGENQYRPQAGFDPMAEPGTSTARTYSGDVGWEDDGELDEAISLGDESIPTAESIEKEGYRQVPPGEPILQVDEIKREHYPKNPVTEVYLKRADGTVRLATFDTKMVQVTLGVPGDPRCSIRDTFYLPPCDPKSNPEQFRAWKYGTSTEESAVKKDANEESFWFKKLIHFLARIGFEQDHQGHFKPEAMVPRNWLVYPGTDVHRLVKLEIKAGQSFYIDKKTGQKVAKEKVYNEIRMFSYAYVPPPKGVAQSQQRAAAAARAAMSPTDRLKDAANSVKQHIAQAQPAPAQGDFPPPTSTSAAEGGGDREGVVMPPFDGGTAEGGPGRGKKRDRVNV